ncbi:hypothetical protein PRIPAC_87013, partial [Pristionchus pacificus]|uniref:Uncharacterized protein n=1 Tax=Pristionchus pacificus TaxID=54126 RepID=A0A2A6BKI2_PRIPA
SVVLLFQYHHSNSTKISDAALTGFKLLCSHGEKYECMGRVGKVRFVDATGVINPDGFYNYLTAWFNQDNMMHYVTQASFFANPPSWAVNASGVVPAAEALAYSYGERKGMMIIFSGICLLLNPWAVVSILAILVWMTTQLVDFHAWAGIKMNPVSAVTTAVGIGVEFTAHVGLAFLTSLGNCQERMAAVVDRIF